VEGAHWKWCLWHKGVEGKGRQHIKGRTRNACPKPRSTSLMLADLARGRTPPSTPAQNSMRAKAAAHLVEPVIHHWGNEAERGESAPQTRPYRDPACRLWQRPNLNLTLTLNLTSPR
jgi:hypothetical protein